MKKYLDNIFILAIILIVSIIVALVFSFKFDRNLYVGKNEIASTVEVKEVTKNDEIIDKIEIKYDWQIAIPKINLVAPIEEGSDIVTLRNNVGHITGTGLKSGNIALAGHTNTANYKNGVFFFDRIDELDLGDRVYYRINNQDYVFKVQDKKVVSENDLSVLDECEKSKLTLITCVVGEHNNRLIVVCVEDDNIKI